MNSSELIPQKVKDIVNYVVDIVAKLLQGETARMIGYGAGLVIFVVAKYVGTLPETTLPDAIAQALAIEGSIALLIEPIRHFVYSPATVTSLVLEHAASGDTEAPGHNTMAG